MVAGFRCALGLIDDFYTGVGRATVLVGLLTSKEGRMLDAILVPLDGSVMSERAIPYASTFARHVGGRIILVHAVQMAADSRNGAKPTEHSVDGPSERLRLLTHNMRSNGLRAEFATLNSAAGTGIVAAARRYHTDLIVMATHSRNDLGRYVFGSATDWVLRHTTVPVMAVSNRADKPWAPTGAPPPRIVVPLDGSELSERALITAGELARALGAEVVLVRAIESEQYAAKADPVNDVGDVWNYLAAKGKQLVRDGIPVTPNVRFGEPPKVILDAVDAFDAGLITIATHGRSGLSRLLLGSQAAAVVRRATVPVVLVRPTASGMSVDPAYGQQDALPRDAVAQVPKLSDLAGRTLFKPGRP